MKIEVAGPAVNDELVVRFRLQQKGAGVELVTADHLGRAEWFVADLIIKDGRISIRRMGGLPDDLFNTDAKGRIALVDE